MTVACRRGSPSAASLGAIITQAVVHHYGRDEFLQRLSQSAASAASSMRSHLGFQFRLAFFMRS
jgi:hypothetical protein